VALALGTLVLSRSTIRCRYGWFVAAVLFLYWHSFATCVETATVNSLDVFRYLTVQLAFVLFAQCLTLLLALEILVYACRLLGSRQTMRTAHPDVSAG